VVFLGIEPELTDSTCIYGTAGEPGAGGAQGDDGFAASGYPGLTATQAEASE
jgi:hypothetical protein